MGGARRGTGGHKLRACLAIHNSYVIARYGLLWRVRLCCVSDFEAQHANDLSVLRQHPHLPAAYRIGGEVLLVRPGAVAFVAPAVDIQGNAVDLFAVEFPHMV